MTLGKLSITWHLLTVETAYVWSKLIAEKKKKTSVGVGLTQVFQNCNLTV